MKKYLLLAICLLLLTLLFIGCASVQYRYREDNYVQKIEKWTVLKNLSIDPAIEEKILSLDPEHIREKDINEILSKAPAPRIINIHGGIYPVHLAMKSFSRFLIAMGYPEEKIRHPGDGSYSYSCYKESEKIAGSIAWYYEKEGMRPILIGHSQGGIQAVKVLHELAGLFNENIPVFNPITEKAEDRYTIIDPIKGIEHPVVGLKVSYATAVGAGGFTRFLPNHWIMLNKLRTIPDTVVEFTGFYMGLDLIGGDFLGFGSTNKYEPNGKAKVRNVKLPTGYSHVTVPVTKHLAESQEIKDWINHYLPTEEPELTVEFESSSKNILWAADVWHSIRKHWVLEAQRLIRKRQEIRKCQ